MNENVIGQAPVRLSTLSRVRPWLGTGLTGLVVLFLAFDGITKVIRVAPVVEACQKLGIGPDLMVGIGIVLLACTAIYATPRTAVLGAILLTGYLGGAAWLHISVRSGIFPTVFAIGFGVLVWVGLGLREPKLFRWILSRR